MMDISVAENGDIKVLSLNGRLDAASSPELDGKITSLTAAGSSLFVIDCLNLDYVSSAGLRVFLIALKKANSMNGNIVLAALKESVMEVFEIAGFSGIFTLAPSVEDAVETLK